MILNLPKKIIIRSNTLFRGIVAGLFLLNSIVPVSLFDNAYSQENKTEKSALGVISPFDTSLRAGPFDISKWEIPVSLGEIKENYRQTEKPTIIHIQDAHCNYSAQMSISGLIKVLTEKYGVSTVFLEGGRGKYDLSAFYGINDPGRREKAAGIFVREGRLSGPEYFAVNNPGKAELCGIEDDGLYGSNLSSYRASLAGSAEVKETLRAIGDKLGEIKEKVYSPELLKLDREKASYRSEKTSFEDYLVFLAGEARLTGTDMKPFGNVSILLKTLEKEKDIDFKRAEKEREKLIAVLREKLSAFELAKLMEKMVLVNKGGMKKEEFYAYLFRKAARAWVGLDEYPSLRSYSEYMHEYTRADKAMIMKEISDLHETLMKKGMSGNVQERLFRIDKYFSVLGDMVAVKLVREDHLFYIDAAKEMGEERLEEFTSAIREKYGVDADISREVSKISSHLRNMEDFYGYSFQRDEVFLKKIVEKTGKAGPGNFILVTGGFHALNLEKLIRNKGYGYVGVMPRLENEEECPYFNILSGGDTRLEGFIHKAVTFGPRSSALAPASLFSEMAVADIRARNGISLEVAIVDKLLAGETFRMAATDGRVIKLVPGKDVGADISFNIHGIDISAYVDLSGKKDGDTEVDIDLLDGDSMSYIAHEVWIDKLGKEAGYRNINGAEKDRIIDILTREGWPAEDMVFVTGGDIRVWNKDFGVKGHASWEAVYISPLELSDDAGLIDILTHEIAAAHKVSHKEITGLTPQERIKRARDAAGGRVTKGYGRKEGEKRDYADGDETAPASSGNEVLTGRSTKNVLSLLTDEERERLIDDLKKIHVEALGIVKRIGPESDDEAFYTITIREQRNVISMFTKYFAKALRSGVPRDEAYDEAWEMAKSVYTDMLLEKDIPDESMLKPAGKGEEDRSVPLILRDAYAKVARSVTSGKPEMFLCPSDTLDIFLRALDLYNENTGDIELIEPITCTPDTDRMQLIGSFMPVSKDEREAGAPRMRFEKGVLYKMVEKARQNKDKTFVLRLDQAEALSGKVWVQLNQYLLTEELYIPETREYLDLPPNLKIISSITTGLKDKAFYDRFNRRQLEIPPDEAIKDHIKQEFGIDNKEVERLWVIYEKWKTSIHLGQFLLLISYIKGRADLENTALATAHGEEIIKEETGLFMSNMRAEDPGAEVYRPSLKFDGERGLLIDGVEVPLDEGLKARLMKKVEEKRALMKGGVSSAGKGLETAMLDKAKGLARNVLKAMTEREKWFEVEVQQLKTQKERLLRVMDDLGIDPEERRYVAEFIVADDRGIGADYEHRCSLMHRDDSKKPLPDQCIPAWFLEDGREREALKKDWAGPEYDPYVRYSGRNVAGARNREKGVPPGTFDMIEQMLSARDIARKIVGYIEENFKDPVDAGGVAMPGSMFLYTTVGGRVATMLEKALKENNIPVEMWEFVSEYITAVTVRPAPWIDRYEDICRFGIRGEETNVRENIVISNLLRKYSGTAKGYAGWEKMGTDTEKVAMQRGDPNYDPMRRFEKYMDAYYSSLMDGVDPAVRAAIKEEVGIIVTRDVAKALSAMSRDYHFGTRVIRLEGPTGTGKTFVSKSFSKMLGLPFYGEPFHGSSKQSKLLGAFKPDGNGDYVMDTDTPFLRLLKDGGVISLSELNAAVKNDYARLAWLMVPMARGDRTLIFNQYPRPPDGEDFSPRFERSEKSFIVIDINPSDTYEARGELPEMLKAYTPMVWVEGRFMKGELKEMAEGFLGGVPEKERAAYAEKIAECHYAIQEELRKPGRKLSEGRDHAISLRELAHASEWIVREKDSPGSVDQKVFDAVSSFYVMAFKAEKDKEIARRIVRESAGIPGSVKGEEEDTILEKCLLNTDVPVMVSSPAYVDPMERLRKLAKKNKDIEVIKLNMNAFTDDYALFGWYIPDSEKEKGTGERVFSWADGIIPRIIEEAGRPENRDKKYVLALENFHYLKPAIAVALNAILQEREYYSPVGKTFVKIPENVKFFSTATNEAEFQISLAEQSRWIRLFTNEAAPADAGSGKKKYESSAELNKAYSIPKTEAEIKRYPAPKGDDELLIPTDDLLEAESLIAGAMNDHRISILEGDPGGGKTDIALDIAQRFGLPSYLYSAHANAHLADFIGSYTQDEKGDIILTGKEEENGHFKIPFLDMFKHGGVFIIDEGAIGKRSQALISWLTGIARGDQDLVINEHIGIEPIKIKRNPHFHIIITTNVVDETPGRESLPIEILTNSQRVFVNNDYSDTSYKMILDLFYKRFSKKHGVKVPDDTRESFVGTGIKLHRLMRTFVAQHAEVENPDRHLFTLRDLSKCIGYLHRFMTRGMTADGAMARAVELVYFRQFSPEIRKEVKKMLVDNGLSVSMTEEEITGIRVDSSREEKSPLFTKIFNTAPLGMYFDEGSPNNTVGSATAIPLEKAARREGETGRIMALKPGPFGYGDQTLRTKVLKKRDGKLIILSGNYKQIILWREGASGEFTCDSLDTAHTSWVGGIDARLDSSDKLTIVSTGENENEVKVWKEDEGRRFTLRRLVPPEGVKISSAVKLMIDENGLMTVVQGTGSIDSTKILIWKEDKDGGFLVRSISDWEPMGSGLIHSIKAVKDEEGLLTIFTGDNRCYLTMLKETRGGDFEIIRMGEQRRRDIRNIDITAGPGGTFSLACHNPGTRVEIWERDGAGDVIKGEGKPGAGANAASSVKLANGSTIVVTGGDFNNPIITVGEFRNIGGQMVYSEKETYRAEDGVNSLSTSLDDEGCLVIIAGLRSGNVEVFRYAAPRKMEQLAQKDDLSADNKGRKAFPEDGDDMEKAEKTRRFFGKGARIDSEESVKKDLDDILDNGDHALLMLEKGAREYDILKSFVAERSYEYHPLESSPEMTDLELLGGLFPIVEGDEAPKGKEFKHKPGFLERHMVPLEEKGKHSEKKLLVIHNIDALREKVRAQLNNFLIKGYLDVKDDSGVIHKYCLPDGVKLVATISDSSQREFSSAFFNRFIKVHVSAPEASVFQRSELVQLLMFDSSYDDELGLDGTSALDHDDAQEIQAIYCALRDMEKGSFIWPSGKSYNYSLKEALLLGRFVRLAKQEAVKRGIDISVRDNVERIIAQEALRLYGGSLKEKSEDYKIFMEIVLKSVFSHKLVAELSGDVDMQDGMVESLSGVTARGNGKGAKWEETDVRYRLTMVPQIARTMSSVLRGWQAGKIVSIAGETGTAKTTMGVFLAQILFGRKTDADPEEHYYVYSTHGQSHSRDISMQLKLKAEGGFTLEEQEFMRRVEKGDQVIILDEANMRPEMLWALNGIARGDKEITIEIPGGKARKFKVGKNVHILMTMNPESYTDRGEVPTVLNENIFKMWAPSEYTDDELTKILNDFSKSFEAKAKLKERAMADALNEIRAVANKLTVEGLRDLIGQVGPTGVRNAITREDALELENEILARPDVIEKMEFIRGKVGITAPDITLVFSLRTWWSQSLDGKVISVPLFELDERLNPGRSVKAVVGLITHELRHKRYSPTEEELKAILARLGKGDGMDDIFSMWNMVEDHRIDLIRAKYLEGENEFIDAMNEEMFGKSEVEKALENFAAVMDESPHLVFKNFLLLYGYADRLGTKDILHKSLQAFSPGLRDAINEVILGPDGSYESSAHSRATRAKEVVPDYASVFRDAGGDEAIQKAKDLEKMRTAEASVKVMLEEIFPVYAKLRDETFKKREKQKEEKEPGEKEPGDGEPGEKEPQGGGQPGENKPGKGKPGPGKPGKAEGEPDINSKPRFMQMTNEELQELLSNMPDGVSPQNGAPGLNPGKPGQTPKPGNPAEEPKPGEPDAKPKPGEPGEEDKPAEPGAEPKPVEPGKKPGSAEPGEGETPSEPGKEPEPGELKPENPHPDSQGTNFMPGRMDDRELDDRRNSYNSNLEKGKAKRRGDMKLNEKLNYQLAQVSQYGKRLGKGLVQIFRVPGEPDVEESATGWRINPVRYLTRHPEPFDVDVEALGNPDLAMGISLDVSGSMIDEGYLPALKKMLAIFMGSFQEISKKRAEYSVSFITSAYDDRKPFREKLSQGQLNAVYTELENGMDKGGFIDPRNGIALYETVSGIIRKYKDSNKKNKMELVITDGKDIGGDLSYAADGKPIPSARLRKKLDEARKLGIEIVGIGFNTRDTEIFDNYLQLDKDRSELVVEALLKLARYKVMRGNLPPKSDLVKLLNLNVKRATRSVVSFMSVPGPFTADERTEAIDILAITKGSVEPVYSPVAYGGNKVKFLILDKTRYPGMVFDVNGRGQFALRESSPDGGELRIYLTEKAWDRLKRDERMLMALVAHEAADTGEAEGEGSHRWAWGEVKGKCREGMEALIKMVVENMVPDGVKKLTREYEYQKELLKKGEGRFYAPAGGTPEWGDFEDKIYGHCRQALMMAGADGNIIPPGAQINPNGQAILREMIMRRQDIQDRPGRFDSTFRVFMTREETGDFPYVVKVPKKPDGTGALKKAMEFAKANMGGIMAPFDIVEDVTIAGTRYEFAVIQKRFIVKEDEPRLPETCELPDGRTINLWESEKKLILELVKKGIHYPDSLIPKNYGIDPVTGEMFLIDHGEAYFAGKDDREVFNDEDPDGKGKEKVFQKRWGDGIHFDRIGLPGDAELYALWGTKQNECVPVPGVFDTPDRPASNTAETRSPVSAGDPNGRIVVSAGKPVTAEEYGGERLTEAIKSPGAEIVGALNRALFDGKPCLSYVMGAVPTDDKGAVIEAYTLDSPLSREISAARRFSVNKRLGNVTNSHSMGVDGSRDNIMDILGRVFENVPKALIHCSVSKSVLDALDGDKPVLAAINAKYDEIAERSGAKAQACVSVKQFLSDNTMLDVINDMAVGENGVSIVLPMPFARATLHGYAKLNLSNIVESTPDAEKDELAGDEGYKQAVRGVGYTIALLTNNMDNVDEIIGSLMDEARKNTSFFRAVFDIALPPVVKIDYNMIKAMFEAEAAALSSL